MSVENEVKQILIDTLQLKLKPEDLSSDTQLLGALPEFDSMAVVSLLTAIEEFYGFSVDDDEVEAEMFETLGSVVAFVNSKI